MSFATIDEQIKKVYNCRKVIITGGVAVGKSSTVHAVCEQLKQNNIPYKFIPEYIDVRDDALTMLNCYLSKSISSYDFQLYIIKFYEEYLSSLRLNGNEILIFERSVDDSITCFSNMDNKKGRLSIMELYRLYECAFNIDKTFNIPSYFEHNDYIFIPIKTDSIDKDGKLITEIINNRNHENIVIGLYNTNEQCYKRMLKRDRPGEKDSYTLESISNFNNNYKHLYYELMNSEDSCIIFTSLGKLID